MTTTNTPTLLVETLGAGEQSRTLTQIFGFNGRKVRVSVKADSYKHQGHARAELWDGNRWHESASLLPMLMASAGKGMPGIVQRALDEYEALIRKDAQEVLRQALLVIE